MKSSYYLELLQGRSQELPDVRSKVVRVFVSSTFTGHYHSLRIESTLSIGNASFLDTLAERDSLIENIFPKLKDYSRQNYGLEFQVCSSILLIYPLLLFSLHFTRSMLTWDGEFKLNQQTTMEKLPHVSMRLNSAKSILLLPISWFVFLSFSLSINCWFIPICSLGVTQSSIWFSTDSCKDPCTIVWTTHSNSHCWSTQSEQRQSAVNTMVSTGYKLCSTRLYSSRYLLYHPSFHFKSTKTQHIHSSLYPLTSLSFS